MRTRERLRRGTSRGARLAFTLVTGVVFLATSAISAEAGITGTTGAVNVVTAPTSPPTLTAGTRESNANIDVWFERVIINAGSQSFDHAGAGTTVNNPFPSSRLDPQLIVGFTDARVYRNMGAVAYGAGLFSPDLSASDFGNRFHGNDERIDVESLALTTQLWVDVVNDLMT